mgnify:CR=1 FL=1
MQFFRKTKTAFNEIKTMDVDSLKNYEKLHKDAEGMGTRDSTLNRMMVYDKQDKEDMR